MRSMLHKWLLSAMVLLISCSMVAQTKLLSTDFSQGIPSSWGESPANPTYGWTTGASGIGTLTPHVSTAYAMIHATENQSAVKLVTTRVDKSTLSTPVLSYWFAQPAAEGGNFDNLKIYYRTSLTGAWTLLRNETQVTPYWTHRVISLSDIADSYIQIAFEYNYNGGEGVALDDVYLDNMSLCIVPTGLSAVSITENSAMLVWNSSEACEQFDLKVSTTPMEMLTE